MKDFIQIDKYRIRKSCIKKYIPEGNVQLNIYYSPSRNKIDVEIIKFSTTKARNIALTLLDAYFIK